MKIFDKRIGWRYKGDSDVAKVATGFVGVMLFAEVVLVGVARMYAGFVSVSDFIAMLFSTAGLMILIIGSVEWIVNKRRDDKHTSDVVLITTDDGKEAVEMRLRKYNEEIYVLMRHISNSQCDVDKIADLVNKAEAKGILLPYAMRSRWERYTNIPCEHIRLKKWLFREFIGDIKEACIRCRFGGVYNLSKFEQIPTAERTARFWRTIMLWDDTVIILYVATSAYIADNSSWAYETISLFLSPLNIIGCTSAVLMLACSVPFWVADNLVFKERIKSEKAKEAAAEAQKAT
jgi:hypothetical protein